MTPEPGSQDRGWLRYDPAPGAPDGPSGDGVPGSGPGADEPVRDDAAPSPWLRHEPAEGDPDGPPAEADHGPAHDPVWLEPELDVPARPTDDDHDTDDHDTGDHDTGVHDTGVPPTLAEEPSSVQRSDPADPGTGPGTGAGTDHAAGDDAGAEEQAGLGSVAGAALKEFAIVVGMALVLSFIVKTWLLQAFYIPSGSMEDTLVLNDRVIVSKLTPGPVDLKRGDIIVFADPGEWLEETPQVPHGKVVTAFRETMTFVGLLPDNSENHLIKRVIGLPGDHVVCCDEGGRITVNGTAIKEPYLKPGDAASDQDFDITVPRGRVWVMGDHRSNSADSRAHDAPENNGSQGSVDERLIVGRAVALVWPLDHMTWLSNPTATFAKVPNPSSQDTPQPSDPGEPQGDPSSQTGGVEVTGGDGDEGG